MEEIIILILFTYPGAMADYFHKLMIRGKQYDNDPDEHFRIARDFFLSALITLITMLFFCGIRRIDFTLSIVMKELQKGENLWVYGAFSLIAAFVISGVWVVGNKAYLQVTNRGRASRGTATLDETKNVWASMMTDPEIPFRTCALAVYQDGKLIRAGLAHNVSDDYKNDPWAVLTYSDTAKADLERPLEERSILISPEYSFVNIENGIAVDIYDGSRFREFLSSVGEEQAAEN